MSGALLALDQVSLQLPGRVLLRGLDWQVAPGQFWCVLGRNGAGKSTLLHTVAGLLPLEEGRIHLAGQPLAQWSPARLALLRGLLLQQQYDAFSLPVLDAVLAGRFAHGTQRNEAADQRLALQALERVGLSALAGADLTRLSGGERQRVGLATLLTQDPELYLLDEPTSHQDIAAQLAIMQLLRETADEGHGRAVVASCHDLNLAQRFATHVLLLGEGAHWQGTVQEVMRVDWLSQAFSCRFRALADGSGVPLLVAQ